jgi:hypothetical protein
MRLPILLLALLVPTISHAASVQQLVTNMLAFVQNILIPFILAIAFLIFVYNAVRFFIIGGASEDGQENGKNLVIYSLLAFVIILSFWGIVNIVVNGLWGNSLEINPDCHFRVSDYVANTSEPCSADPFKFGPS